MFQALVSFFSSLFYVFFLPSRVATFPFFSSCWTYSHHCQIADKKPSKGSRNGEFRGLVCVLDGFPQRHFVLWVFMSPINISPFRPFRVFSVTIFYGYHAKGYHAPSIPHGLPRLYHHCTAITSVYIFRLPRQGLPSPILTTTGYHACVFIPVITPELSRSTTLVHRVITPAIVVRIL